MPGWWPELAEVPGVDDHQELAQKVQASFEFPQQISEWHGVENYHQAPPGTAVHPLEELPPTA